MVSQCLGKPDVNSFGLNDYNIQNQFFPIAVPYSVVRPHLSKDAGGNHGTAASGTSVKVDYTVGVRQ